MRKYFYAAAFSLLFTSAIFWPKRPAFAVEKSTKVLTQNDFTCYASTTFPTNVLPNRPNRTGYAFINLAGSNIRISFQASSTTFNTLTSTNSIQVPSQNAMSDQVPSVSTLPMYCQSTTAGALTLTVIEFGQ